MSIPAGRIMNTFIQEYVLNEHPTRWSNGQQKELTAHWFEEHPRTCAEDDGGYCTAEGLPDYSGDLSHAMALSQAKMLVGTSLSMKSVTTPSAGFWATFYNVPYESKTYRWKDYWASGSTMAEAICRAALLATAK